MPHTAQERYSSLVDEKLRNTLVTRDNLIFNNRYEGDPKAGKVKIPVRDTEVEVKTYNKQTGATISQGSTTYFDLDIDVDEAVNEMIDGFDSASVPDGITAERLDSAGYSLGLSMDTKSIRKLEETTGITVATSKTACTDTTAYKQVLTAKRVQSRLGVPNDGKRWLIASPEFMEVLMSDDHFIRQGDLSQELVQNGVVGRIAGYNVFESNNTMFELSQVKKLLRSLSAVIQTGVIVFRNGAFRSESKTLLTNLSVLQRFRAEKSMVSEFPNRRPFTSSELKPDVYRFFVLSGRF